jgi:hypothetical protein
MPELAWAVQSGGGAGQRGGGFAARQSGQTTAGSSLYRFLVEEEEDLLDTKHKNSNQIKPTPPLDSGPTSRIFSFTCFLHRTH